MKTSVRRPARTGKYLIALVVVCLAGLLTYGAMYAYGSSVPAPSLTVAQLTVEPAKKPSALAWPGYGQAAIATKDYGVVATHGSDTPQPTASTAKLITALAIMQRRPFTDGAGETITFTEQDVASYERYVLGNGTATSVIVGLSWTQHQALQAVLLDSANNVSDTLARWAFGSLEAYQRYAQEMVRELGMHDTTIGVDASGYDASTTSTAHDLALLAAKVLEDPMLRQIVGEARATLPGAGVIENTNHLLSDAQIHGMKTGWIPEAGGVFVLSGEQSDGEHVQDIITVVMGEPSGPSRTVQDDAYRLYQSAKENFSYQLVLNENQLAGQYQLAWDDTSVELHVAESVGMFVWSGEAPLVTVRGEPHPERRSQAAAGSVTVAFKDWQTQVPLTLAQPLSEPTAWWRLGGRFVDSFN